MDDQGLQNLRYDPVRITCMTKEIWATVMSRSDCLREPDFTLIGTRDLRNMFELYDEYFLGHYFRDRMKDRVRLRLSPGMSRAAGKTIVRRDGTFEIRMATDLFFQTFDTVQREVKINGIVCHDRLEAFQRTLEHEIVHVLEAVLYGRTSCSGDRFRSMARDIFGHTEVTHGLVTAKEIAGMSCGLRVGCNAAFEVDGRPYKGIITRITKRATVMVEDPEGVFVDGKGRRFTKVYVPLGLLRPAKGGRG